MAKGSRNGIARGKKGDTVYFQISGSNNKQKQGERQYTAEISNPKTVAQAAQRLKALPAALMYKAFGDEILDHSFQGVTYGARCNAVFMKYALSMESKFPFVGKDRDRVAPGEYLMSKGSIPSLQYYFRPINQEGGISCLALAMEDGSDTYGEWCQEVLTRAPWLRNGDQVTFAFIVGTEDGFETPSVHRIVLDVTSTITAGEVVSSAGLLFGANSTIKPDSFTGYDVQAACIIISRPRISPSNGSVTWQRSTERMKVNYSLEYLVYRFYTQTAYDAAINSYTGGNAKHISSPWYLNQGQSTTQQQLIPKAPIEIPFAQGITAQCHDEDSPFYGMYFATLRNSDGQRYLIAEIDSTDRVDPYGYAPNGGYAVIGTTLYRIHESAAQYATDEYWTNLVKQYDGVLTGNQAVQMAAANGVTLTIHTT